MSTREARDALSRAANLIGAVNHDELPADVREKLSVEDYANLRNDLIGAYEVLEGMGEPVGTVFGFYDSGEPSVEWIGQVAEGDSLYAGPPLEET